MRAKYRLCPHDCATVLLEVAGPQAFSPSQGARSGLGCAEETEVEGMESSHLLYHHVPLCRLHVDPDDRAEARLQHLH